jgi:hypothetical protein
LLATAAASFGSGYRVTEGQAVESCWALVPLIFSSLSLMLSAELLLVPRNAVVAILLQMARELLMK